LAYTQEDMNNLISNEKNLFIEDKFYIEEEEEEQLKEEEYKGNSFKWFY